MKRISEDSQPSLPWFEDSEFDSRDVCQQTNRLTNLQTVDGLLALMTIPRVGAKTALALAEKFRDLSRLRESVIHGDINFLSADQLDSILGISIIPDLERDNVHALCIYDGDYPSALKDLENPPPIIWYLGKLHLLETRCLAIVGTREPSGEGTAIAANAAHIGVVGGFSIVSGFARGIDQIAHKETLNSSGKAIAVLGTSIDLELRGSNSNLLKEIVANDGLIISATPRGSKPNQGSFIERNAYISAISQVIFIAECRVGSGTMHTAGYALAQGKRLLVAEPHGQAKSFSGNTALLSKELFRPELFAKNINLRRRGIFADSPDRLPLSVSDPDALREALRD